MNIEEYFNDYKEKYHEMKKALKRYIDAKSGFYYLTGVKYDDMPKANGKSLGLDDLISNIEELHNKYLDLVKECNEERKKCQVNIDKIKNHVSRLIIEYAYLDLDKDKKIISSLKEFHNIEYSCSHFRKLKSDAIKEFEELIHENTK